jgi:outer membrane lipoprotein-sorting protein
MHTPADNQVIVSAVPTDDQATTAVLFLTGKGNLARDFGVSFVDGAPAVCYALKLRPKLPERDYDWLQLVVDRRHSILALTAAESRHPAFTFTNFKKTSDCPIRHAFTIPRGADVIQAGSPGR